MACGEQLAAARAAFKERGYTAHTPTLRYHELPIQEGAMKIASLSLRDYTDDLVAFVNSLDSPPLLVGHSMGGLLAQLVAVRTRHTGLVAVCPAPAAGIFATNLTNVRMSLPYYLRPRPWAKPVHPPTWERFRREIAKTQTETPCARYTTIWSANPDAFSASCALRRQDFPRPQSSTSRRLQPRCWSSEPSTTPIRLPD
jgi:pimeloyl-ACP methyl ester carboxylesterase